MAGPVPEKLDGRYYPPGNSGSLDASLHDEKGQLVVTLLDGGKVPVTFSHLSDRLGKVPRKIYFSDGSVFECADNDGVDLAFGKDRHFFTRMSRWERSWKFVLAATVLTVVLLVAFYRVGIPAIANLAAQLTPTPVLVAIDAGASDTIDRVMFSESKMEASRKQELTQLFNEVAAASGHEQPPLKLLFRDGGRIGANALALPGGTVILTDQMDALVESEDEIAGVFAHEIGHIAERHALRQIYRVLGLTFMISLIGGDSGQIVEEVLGQLVLVENFSYTRAFEMAADAYSVRVMQKAGRDPKAFIELLDRVFEEAGLDADAETNWFDTHPGNKDRRQQVEDLIGR